MVCDFADVVLVPFPFVDRPIAKRRPALVLSSAPFNGDYGQSILAMITTAGHSAWPSDIEITDWASAGLVNSVVRWKVFTLPNDQMLRQLGHLGAADRANVAAFTNATMASQI